MSVSKASGSILSQVAFVERRPKDCLLCCKTFTSQLDLYRHLYNKNVCNSKSDKTIEEAIEYANIPDYYKCDFCKVVILDKKIREEHKLKCDKKDLIDNLEINNINPIISYLFVVNEDGKVISNIDKETGYINATIMCKSVNKELNDFMKNDSTIKLIQEIKEKYNKNQNITDYTEDTEKNENSRDERNYICNDNFIIKKPSILNSKVNHTYFCEELAIPLAMWCSTKYTLKIAEFIIKFKNGLIKTEDSIKAKQDIEEIKNGKLDSVTNYTNKHDPQVYFITFDINFKDIDAIYINTKNKFNENNGFIIKYGNQKKNSTRQSTHKSMYDNYKILDTIKCYDHDNLEKYVEEIINENRIKIFEPKKVSGEEYIYFKTQEEYNDLIEKTKIKADELNKILTEDLFGNNNELEIEKEKTKQKQEETKHLELKLKIEEIELKKLELTKESNVEIPKEKIRKKCGRPEQPRLPKPKKDEFSSKYLGVTRWFSNKTNELRYIAKIFSDGQEYYLGKYITQEEAGYAYNCMKKELTTKHNNKFNDLDLSKTHVWNSEKRKLNKIPEGCSKI